MLASIDDTRSIMINDYFSPNIDQSTCISCFISLFRLIYSPETLNLSITSGKQVCLIYSTGCDTFYLHNYTFYDNAYYLQACEIEAANVCIIKFIFPIF